MIYRSLYVARAKWPAKNGKIYETIWLRESWREGGKVKKRDLVNLTHHRPAEIATIELALKHRGNLVV